MWSIAICGNMGSGKSSLAQFLAQEQKAHLFSESVEDNPILSQAYADRANFNFILQTYFLFRRFNDATSPLREKTNCIFDRFIYDGPEAFVPTHVKLGLLSKIEAEVLRLGYTRMLEFVRPPSLLVYLWTTPQTALEHANGRGRPFEKHVSSQFINAIHSSYETFFERYNLGPKMRVDVDQVDFIRDLSARTKLIDAIVSAARSVK